MDSLVHLGDRKHRAGAHIPARGTFGSRTVKGWLLRRPVVMRFPTIRKNPAARWIKGALHWVIRPIRNPDRMMGENSLSRGIVAYQPVGKPGRGLAPSRILVTREAGEHGRH